MTRWGKGFFFLPPVDFAEMTAVHLLRVEFVRTKS